MNSVMSDQYGLKISNVMEQVATAAAKCGRKPNDITLIAVSKTQPVEAIVSAYNHGIRHFGENRAKELESKISQLSYLPDIEWNFIGSLQSKHSRPVAQLAHVFHAVDRTSIASTLSQHLTSAARVLEVYLQVNVSGEESKSGFECSEWETNPDQRTQVINAVSQIAALSNIHIRGLMTMTPLHESNEAIREIFRRTRHLGQWLQSSFPEQDITGLSMGMSEDFMIAIEEGATCVRVGSAIFK